MTTFTTPRPLSTLPPETTATIKEVSFKGKFNTRQLYPVTVTFNGEGSLKGEEMAFIQQFESIKIRPYRLTALKPNPHPKLRLEYTTLGQAERAVSVLKNENPDLNP